MNWRSRRIGVRLWAKATFCYVSKDSTSMYWRIVENCVYRRCISQVASLERDTVNQLDRIRIYCKPHAFLILHHRIHVNSGPREMRKCTQRYHVAARCHHSRYFGHRHDRAWVHVNGLSARYRNAPPTRTPDPDSDHPTPYFNLHVLFSSVMLASVGTIIP